MYKSFKPRLEFQLLGLKNKAHSLLQKVISFIKCGRLPIKGTFGYQCVPSYHFFYFLGNSDYFMVTH